MGGAWVSLFSGGKDSAWALVKACQADRPVERLLTVHPAPDSYLFHVPATRVARLAAESIGLPLDEVTACPTPRDGLDSTARGDLELEPLERALDAYGPPDELAGITAGAVASTYQGDRLAAMCDRLGCELFVPLWGVDPVATGHDMIDAGFDIRIVAVAADGLDETWLGRRLDHEAIAELAALNERRGVHVLGEGGEYETLVVDGPHMERPIGFEATPEWDGLRGELRIDAAWLEP